jgi:hypothetical protein
MRVNDLISFVNENKNLKEEQIKAKVAKYINTKKYIGVKDKKQIVESIVDDCIMYKDSVFAFNEFNKYITFVMYAIRAYTDIELSDDIEDDYDMLCENNVLDIVVETFKNEYNEINIILNMKCNDILNQNNIESQFGRFLNSISNKIDVFAGVLLNNIENLNIDNLPISVEDIELVKHFLNVSKK